MTRHIITGLVLGTLYSIVGFNIFDWEFYTLLITTLILIESNRYYD